MPFSLDNLDLLNKELEGASERASAVVAGVFLDVALGEILRGFFVKDPTNDKKIFEGTGPLSTFSAKIDIAYRLGLISKREHQIIHTIRSIRNKFAHKLGKVSFSDQSIKAHCKNIEMPISMVTPSFIPLSQKGKVPPLPTISKADSNNPRDCFQETVITLMRFMAGRFAESTRSKRSTPFDFSSAHEPYEVLVNYLKELIQTSHSLSEQLAQIKTPSAEEKLEAADMLKKHQLLIRVTEFFIQQTKAAHEALSHQ